MEEFSYKSWFHKMRKNKRNKDKVAHNLLLDKNRCSQAEKKDLKHYLQNKIKKTEIYEYFKSND